MSRFVTFFAMLALCTGCALYNEVSIAPLNLLPSNVDRGADVHSMLQKGDYLRAIELTKRIQSGRPNASDLAALGSVHLASGRYDEARTLLRSALDLSPFRTKYAEIAWDLSQVEYLSNNMESSLDWAAIAVEHGLQIRQWHIDYLKSLREVPIYRFGGAPSARLPLRFGKPDVPRIDAKVNGESIEAIVDSGAVLSIISERLADSISLPRLGETTGTFYGLLGEAISVRFGVVRSIELEGMVIENVPVAIMPNDKMRFLLSKREGKEFQMNLLLGSHLLKEFRIELDFDRHQIVFTRLMPQERTPDPDQNLFIAGLRPHVRTAVNRRGWYLFILDTGSEITFLNAARLTNLPVQVFGSGTHSATLQGLGGAMKHGAKIENVEVGIDRWGGTFKTLPMYSSGDAQTAVGIIGQNFLKNFNVVIDFGRMRVDLKRR